MDIVLFGAGRIGEQYYNMLKDKNNIICFADNNTAKQGKKFLDLDIISPDKIVELGLDVVISSVYNIDIARQLFEMGIKEFFAPMDYKFSDITRIDLTKFSEVSELPNKISVIRRSHSSSVSVGLVRENPFDDIEVFIINDSMRDSDFYYHYLTSSLIITQFADRLYGNKKSIEIWHGFPVKTVGAMTKADTDRRNFINVHHIYESKNAFCSLSHLYSIFTGYCFNIDFEKFHVTGYPRNDMLYKSDGVGSLQKIFGGIKQKHIIIYMPTYRESENTPDKNGENAFIFNMLGYNEADFNDFLRENDILFLFKAHSWQIEQKTFAESDNIKHLSDKLLDENDLDLYEILNGTDCLISDYSSVIIDYLLVDKPIILTPLDSEEYSETRGLMMEPYDAWMPGEITLDYEQLKGAISNALFGEDEYKKDRERLRRITHKYHDAKSSERVLALARDLLGI